MTEPVRQAEPSPSPSVVNFFMVGCQRCGSTWVDQALREHPQVYLPAQKQTYFFDSAYQRGLDWYMENFRAVQPRHQAVGEVATGYCLPEAVPRMARHFPQVRLLMSVRNPTERAYSYYQSRSVDFGWNSLEQAVEADPGILARGRYMEQIDALLEHYPRERLLLLFYDDLEADDRQYLRSILQFLGVDDRFESSQIGKMVQVALYPRLRRHLRRSGLGPLLDPVSKSALGDVLRRCLKATAVRRYQPISAATRRFLVDYYREHNLRLAEFAGRDLSHWQR